jgi:hypothetical protein
MARSRQLDSLPIWRRALWTVRSERNSIVARRHKTLGFAIVVAILLSALALSPQMLPAQSSSSSSPAPSPPPNDPEGGVTSGGYLIHSSFDVGYRFNDVTGSTNMYDTLVNLQQGPRFLDQTLSMQSVDHMGLLFDNLYVSSVGWGGDPNNYLRLRADKNKWYNFQSSFRRDQNFFDYNLLANPLNPSTSSPSVPVLNSPHLFDTTRRMSDFDLTLLPQSRVSFRFGFSHNNMTGPSFSSVHQFTDALLLQPWNTTMNSYRLGVDWRVAPRTVVSFDQFLDYYKGDTGTQLASATPALLPSPGTGSVELGLPIDTVNKTPCAVVAPATSLIDSTGTLTNLTCNAFFGYARNQRIRTSTPTERLSFRSNAIQRLEVVGSLSYSDADMSTPLNELFSGLSSRSNTLATTNTGTTAAHQISNVADLEITLHLTQHLRLMNKFYLWAYRIPQRATFNELDFSCAAPPCTLLSTPLTTPTVPGGTTTTDLSSFNQSWKRNETQLAWDISKKMGARVGFRYGDREFNHYNDYLPGDLDHFVVNEYTALFGFWARPVHGLRLNFDLEHTNYDNTIVRMAPRKESRYRFQTTYTPRPWVTLGGSVNILEDSNGDALTNYVGHNRNYGFTASLAPRERFGLDVAYNYNDVIQNALICFSDTPPAGVTLPFVANANNNNCAGNDTSNNLMANSYYTNHTNFVSATVRFKPQKRVTANIGYSITNVDGTVPQFNILQPLGSSQYKYQQPLAYLSVDLGHKVAWNTNWNYYQYGEGSFVGPTAPRYFHANSVVESLHYAF